MSQADINAIELTPKGVMTSVARGIPVNARNRWGETALHRTVHWKLRRELAVALLAVGADANAKNSIGESSVWQAAISSIADIVQLLIHGGGSVNEPDEYGNTPLIALARNSFGNAAARLQVLLRCPELDLNTKYDGKTAEEWAVRRGHPELAAAIAEERRKRVRWSTVRCTWASAIARSLMDVYVLVGDAANRSIDVSSFP